MTETQNAIKTVVCPACGLVNLEKFITFPHCAGCAALLSAAPAHAPVSFWHQPLRAPLWVSVIAVCCAALGVLGINIARETAISEERPLMVFANRTRHMTVGVPTTLQFVLDTMAGSPQRNVSQFTNIEIRTPRTMTNDFELMDVSPTPDRITRSEAGVVMEFNALPREEPIRLRLRPRHPGTHRLVISLFVSDFTPFQYRSNISVVPFQPPEPVLVPTSIPKLASNSVPDSAATRLSDSKVTKLKGGEN